jgi:hypothetical protein
VSELILSILVVLFLVSGWVEWQRYKMVMRFHNLGATMEACTKEFIKLRDAADFAASSFEYLANALDARLEALRK